MTYITHWEKEGVYQVFGGILTTKDREESTKEVIENPKFITLKYWIIDSTNIDDYLQNESDATSAAAQDLGASHTNSNINQIFVTTNKKHIENISRYRELLKKANSSWKVSVFSNINLARDAIEKS